MCKKDCNDCAPCKAAATKKNKANFADKKVYFTDKATYSGSEKSLISATDGMLDYAGIELGMQPYDKIFKVFRDAKEIIELAPKLLNLPITDEHISMDGEAYNVIGTVNSSEAKEHLDPDRMVTVAIQNSATFIDESSLAANEFSLGYLANLIAGDESDPFDFKQTDLRPHHLARVLNSRCGTTCTFTDGGKLIMKKKLSDFKIRDEDGKLNLQELMDLINALPEAVGSLTVEKINDLVPVFKEIIEEARANREEKKIGEEAVEEVPAEKIEDADGSEIAQESEEVMDGEDKEVIELKAMDSKKFKDAVAKMVSTQVAEEVKEFSTVIAKAKNFLDASFDYSSKTSKQIMRAALATQYTEIFADAELSTAFKLLKKSSQYKNFGDAKATNALDQLKDKEL